MKTGIICFFAIMCTTGGAHAISIHTSDFIDDSTRTNFNSFESFTGDSPDADYTYDGIRVYSVDGSGINPSWAGDPTLKDGTYGWYHNGGDYGYSVIEMADGSDFDSIGFHAGHGWLNTVERYFSYDLYDNGTSVLSGYETFTSSYLGFSGGGFDEIRIIASAQLASYIGDGTYQALSLDAIETAGAPVPEPATMFLFGTGIAGLVGSRLRRKKK